MSDWPRLGFGLGLRTVHYADVVDGRAAGCVAGDAADGAANRVASDAARRVAGDAANAASLRVDWFEAISENYMDTAGRPLALLERVRRDFPIALHGVALSIGGADPLDEDYLSRLKRLVDRIEPAIVSDHLCWTGVDGRPLFDLLPLPYTEEVLDHVAARVRRVQDRLGRRILLENPSTYVAFRCSTMAESDFLAELAVRADCGLLVDVNNVYVSARNLGASADAESEARAWLDRIPADRVGQIHLAGFTDMGTHLFDTHSRPVADEVWRLFAHARRRFGEVATMVEWDDDIPSFERLVGELDLARSVAAGAGSARCGEDEVGPALAGAEGRGHANSLAA